MATGCAQTSVPWLKAVCAAMKFDPLLTGPDDGSCVYMIGKTQCTFAVVEIPDEVILERLVAPVLVREWSGS